MIISGRKMLDESWAEIFREHIHHVLPNTDKKRIRIFLQNPSDPDTGYSGHKGKGCQVQIAETYNEEEDSENLSLITYVYTLIRMLKRSANFYTKLRTLSVLFSTVIL
ncbi:MAG: hypothetical protein D3924_04620 [Candidatus Electrothrix sp. AR4]|nr:hypothetical protein [Candidatus Electrothrix sp. AR4]